MEARQADVLDPVLTTVPVSAAPTDTAELTLRLKAGDESAWREFHDAYCHRLLRYLLVVTHGDEELARNTVQAAFIRAVRHMRRFDSEATLWNWLTLLAVSAVRDERRKARRYLRFLDRWFAWLTIASPPASPAEPETKVGELLAEALGALSRPDALLLDRKYFEAQSVRDIAEALGCSEKAVESRLTRVRSKLKDLILSRLHDESTPRV